jgi:phosphatidylserine/phosphatidylglycerophosphate/cardiolipin synthase-like enzyme
MSRSLDVTMTNPFSSSSPRAGFGEYEGFSPDNFKAHQTAQKTHGLIVAALIGTAAIGVVIATAFFPVLIGASPIALIGLALLGVRTYLKYCAVHNHFPPSLTTGLNPRDFQAKRVGELIQETGSAHVLPHSIESKKCKLDLIRNAQSSIFLSCYMGKETFDEVLDLIKERVEQKRDLKVFILTSNYFLTTQNRKRIDFLKTTYPNQFFAVFNPEIYHSQHPKRSRQLFSTNHIKLTAIDQGAYAVIGGSALIPAWTDVTGTEHLTKLNSPMDIFNPVEAKGYRDMDFAFKSAPGGAGTTAFLEGAKLMLRYAHLQDPDLAFKLKAQFLEVMQSTARVAQIPSLDARTDRANDVKMKLFATGPDHTQNSYLHALIDLINNAKTKVVISHLFFHPPQQLIDALSNGAKRGVKIEIITNGKDKESPSAHGLFVDLARDKYRQLFEREGHQNVKVREFYRANTTYHKKIVVVDDRYVGFGSSNFGIKSLADSPADYEFNGIADSPVLAAATNRILQKDIELSNEVSPEKGKHPTWGTRFRARFQEFFMTPFL